MSSGKLALITEQEQITYPTLNEKEDALYAHLPAEKKLIFIFCQNNIASIVGYRGGLHYQHCVALLDAKMAKTLQIQLINHYKPHYIWEPLQSEHTYAYMAEGYGLRVYSHKPIAIHSQLSLLLTTSGSTGSPKFVRLSQANLDSNAAAITEYLQLSSEEKPITTLPMHYVFGLSILNSHFKVKAPIVLTERTLFDKLFWTLAQTQAITSLSGVPYTYEILRRLGIFQKQLPHLRILTHAGGRLSESLYNYFSREAKARNIQFYSMYGQAEATARISYLPPGDVRPNSIGKAIPGGRLWIDSKRGELMYQGENVMLGYATSREDLSKGDELGGILATGDLACMDSDGYFYITGRIKRFAKLMGHRINLDDIETQLIQQGFQVACLSHDDSLTVVTLNDSDHQSIKSFISQQFKLHHQVIKCLNLPSLPRTPAGKIDYPALEDIANG